MKFPAYVGERHHQFIIGFVVEIGFSQRQLAHLALPHPAKFKRTDNRLAAIQIGKPVRLVTIDVSKKSEDDEETPKTPMVFVNPEVTWSSEEKNVYEEGCLSIPEYYEEVERPARVKVRYMDLDGAMQEIEADGLLATCLQHEIDHLNGVLFIDYLSRLKRERVTKRFAKAARRESAA